MSSLPTNLSSSSVTPHAPRWYQQLGGMVIWLFLQGIAATVRFRWKDDSDYFSNRASPPVIFCIWHNRLALTLSAYHRYVRRRHSSAGIAAMVSASKDGALLVAILNLFKVQPVRGSSSRRGRQALLELKTWAERGYDLAITPDGPRGPCYSVQDGILSLAQVTGMAVLPVSFVIDWKIRPKTWDRFQIPLPFSRCEVIFGKPMTVPREATDAEREKLRELLESRLMAITKD